MSSSIVIDLYGASRSASNALLVPLRKDEFSETIGSCRYTEQGPGESLKASSIPSDPQQRKPDNQTCCDVSWNHDESTTRLFVPVCVAFESTQRSQFLVNYRFFNFYH